jgi:hypothetical protein
MIRLRGDQRSEIQYILITDHVPLLRPFLPPMEIQSEPFDFLRKLPKDIIQIPGGLSYFELCQKTGVNNPIRFHVVYSNNLGTYLNASRKDVLQVFFLDAKIATFQDAVKSFEKNHSDLHYYHLYNSSDPIDFTLNNYVKTPGEFMESVVINYDKIIDLMGFPKQSIAPDVSIYDKDFYKYPYFIPAQNNYHIVNSMIGNFSYGAGKEVTMDELIELHKVESQKAFKEPNSFVRMDMISREIKKLDYFSFLLSKEKLTIPVHEIDPIFSPLILVAPFHNPDIRHIKSMTPDGDEEAFKTFLRSLDIEQTENYIGNSSPTNTEGMRLTGQLAKSKNEYLDNVSLLHASFEFSPILRLPSQGKSIYRNLSFFRTEAMGVISQPKNRRNIKKTIKKFGQELAKKTISEKVKQSFITKNRQVVSITDLPIEWLDIDGIPLAFTHDVCRVPETSLHGILATFTANEQFEYSVPTDILKKTLVIYGSNEPAFTTWRRPVDHLSHTHGFNTQVCLSVQAMLEAVIKFKPDLLIFDCHGGFDDESNSSFLMLGEEQLTGNKVIEYDIHAPLVFLSACNTAPTYGTINTIANAFFQTNCLSVTTTYLPINIATGSILYLRLLNNLKMASTEAIHHNWLNFVSHVIRTSAVSDAFAFLSKTNNKNIDDSKAAILQAKSFNLLMSFYHRRKMFEELDDKLRKLAGSEEQLFSKIIPEYLFYSNLGRSDLIKFDSYVEKYDQINDNLKLKKA